MFTKLKVRPKNFLRCCLVFFFFFAFLNGKKKAKFTTNVTKPFHCCDRPHKLNSHILQNEKHL